MGDRDIKDIIHEHNAISGILYVTIDKKLLHFERFNQHMKVQIVFDKSILTSTKIENQHLDDILEKESLHVINDDLTDDNDNHNSDNAEENDDEDFDNGPEEYDDSYNADFACTTGVGIKSQEPIPALCKKGLMVESVVNGENTIISQEMDAPVPSSKSRGTSSTLKRRGSSKLRSFKRNTKSAVELNEVNANGKQKSDFQKSDEDDDVIITSVQEKEKEDSKSEGKETVCCPYCSKSFNSEREVRAHYQIERKAYQCKTCKRTLNCKAALIVHNMHKHNIETPASSVEKPLPTFRVKSSFGNNTSTCTSVCSIGTDNTGSKTFRCNICDLGLVDIHGLRSHIMIHTVEKFRKCCLCGCTPRSWLQHMGSHFRRRPGLFECKMCNVYLSSRAELAKHQLTHTFQCGLCDRSFHNRATRYFHYKTIHTNDILKCHLCGRLYSCEKALASHLKYHRHRTQTQCTVCGLVVVRLSSHMLSHSHSLESNIDESNLLVCDQCPKRFKSKASLAGHLMSHIKEKLYCCSICPKQFKTSGSLTLHMRIHMEKKHVCEICGKSCHQLCNLKTHMRVHKKKSDPVPCSYCGVEFPHNRELQDHIATLHRETNDNNDKVQDQNLQTNPVYQMYF